MIDPLTMKMIKGLFGLGLTGIALSLGMTVYLGVKEHHAQSHPAPLTIPVPAIQQ